MRRLVVQAEMRFALLLAPDINSLTPLNSIPLFTPNSLEKELNLASSFSDLILVSKGPGFTPDPEKKAVI